MATRFTTSKSRITPVNSLVRGIPHGLDEIGFDHFGFSHRTAVMSTIVYGAMRSLTSDSARRIRASREAVAKANDLQVTFDRPGNDYLSSELQQLWAGPAWARFTILDQAG